MEFGLVEAVDPANILQICKSKFPRQSDYVAHLEAIGLPKDKSQGKAEGKPGSSPWGPKILMAKLSQRIIVLKLSIT